MQLTSFIITLRYFEPDYALWRLFAVHLVHHWLIATAYVAQEIFAEDTKILTLKEFYVIFFHSHHTWTDYMSKHCRTFVKWDTNSNRVCIVLKSIILKYNVTCLDSWSMISYNTTNMECAIAPRNIPWVMEYSFCPAQSHITNSPASDTDCCDTSIPGVRIYSAPSSSVVSSVWWS